MNYDQKRKLYIRIMCIVLAILMVGSVLMTALYSCVGV